MMTESATDFQDVYDLEKIIPKMEKITDAEADKITEEISKYQPIIIKLILSFDEEFGDTPAIVEVIRNYMIIWEFFKTKGTVRNKIVTEKMYNDRMVEIAQFYKYYEGSSTQEQEKLIEADCNKAKHKMLEFIISMRVRHNKKLEILSPEQRMNIAIAYRCLIECLSDCDER